VKESADMKPVFSWLIIVVISVIVVVDIFVVTIDIHHS
jgi:hypothetical protein